MAKSTSSEPKDKTPLISIQNEKPDLRKKEQPLLSLQVTNPVTYLKRWWKRVIGNEGIDFRFRIRPLTAIAISIVVATLGFGVGRFTFSSTQPYIHYLPPQPEPTLSPWRETAFTGILKYSPNETRYYLLTAASEAINLEVPENIDLGKLTDKRIFATGNYNSKSHTLIVATTEDLEILPIKITPIPTTAIPTPTPTLTPIPTPTTIQQSTPSPTETITN